ncbi:MAG: hypothetical protein J6I37_06135 [Prevotella sp.]|nr:hypothetical protein [Prevotella sp.]
MKYKFEVTQTIYKNINIEAKSEREAMDKINKMLNKGEIHFDNEPFLKIECNWNLVEKDI